VLLMAVAAVLMSSCATLQHVSAGQTGCSPEEVAISEDQMGWNTRTWTAECKGQFFQCSAHGGGAYSTPQVSCKPEVVAAKPGQETAPAAAAAAGCSYDTQCKGDRVCVKGACVDPSSTPAASSVVPASGTQPAPAAPATPQ
jgi:hypothetical protein